MAKPNLKSLPHEHYGVAIICPLVVEANAVRFMLEEQHADPSKKPGDSNGYVCGEMSGHNVVIAYLPHGSQGLAPAAAVATDMNRTFPSISLRLLVGIGGGVPSKKKDVRLGDVVVGMPTETHGGVVQYDLGRTTETGFIHKGFLDPPPTTWRERVARLQLDHANRDNYILKYLENMIERHPRQHVYNRPTTGDILFRPSSVHVKDETDCLKCDQQIVERRSRGNNDPVIHYGLIASGNQVMKKASTRDEISQEYDGVLCFEMEAAGMTNFRCIVIRGICDYADSHKNDDWHAYAAAVAAGYAKELLTYLEPAVRPHHAGDLLRCANQHCRGTISKGDCVSWDTNTLELFCKGCSTGKTPPQFQSLHLALEQTRPSKRWCSSCSFSFNPFDGLLDVRTPRGRRDLNICCQCLGDPSRKYNVKKALQGLGGNTGQWEYIRDASTLRLAWPSQFIRQQ